MQVFIPDRMRHVDVAVLAIRNDKGNHDDTEEGSMLARETGMVWVYLYDVPNQPLFGGLIEDALIAHTLVQYLETGDPSWPLLFPMVKSAVRAMDAIQEMLKERGLQAPVRFVATGASKRGWTSWLLPVVDARIVGIVPLVYDNLNLFAQMPHQLEVWGGYSEQIGDYTHQGLQQKMKTERGQRLTAMLDPFSYRSRLQIPKLIINGANDRYWTTDALNLYWRDLVGPKWIVYLPNEGHSFTDMTRYYRTGAAFLRMMAAERPMPILEWSFSTSDGRADLTLDVDIPAAWAQVWTAESETRDFRTAVWSNDFLLESNGGKHWKRNIPLPNGKYFAAFGEILFGMSAQTFSLSTQPFLVGPGG